MAGGTTTSVEWLVKLKGQIIAHYVFTAVGQTERHFEVLQVPIVLEAGEKLELYVRDNVTTSINTCYFGFTGYQI